ncbi:MAG: HYExAFE family protein [Gemmataceae bacterium]|nr:HYExAFE family protein [Gemmataceae bacterium]
MDRSNPYEAAFEAYLQAHGLCSVAVDETRRSLWGRTSVKNLDFIVLGPAGTRLLVDVKGRQFPGGPEGKERYVWENWSTLEDIDGMESWTKLFGPGSLGLFVFLYRIRPSVSLAEDALDLFLWCGERYLLRAVTVQAYRRHMKLRSPKWGTVHLPSNVYRELARPFRFFSHEYCREDGDGYGPDQDRPLFESAELAFSARAGGGAETGGGGH